MKTTWFINATTEEDRDKLRESLKNSSWLLDILREICYNNIKKQEKTLISDFDVTNWSHKRAYQDGYINAWRELAELLTLDKREQ